MVPGTGGAAQGAAWLRDGAGPAAAACSLCCSQRAAQSYVVSWLQVFLRDSVLCSDPEVCVLPDTVTASPPPHLVREHKFPLCACGDVLLFTTSQQHPALCVTPLSLPHPSFVYQPFSAHWAVMLLPPSTPAAPRWVL